MRRRAKAIPRKKKKKETLKTALHSIYYNYGEEGALANTPRLLLRLVRARGFPKADEKAVKDFLQSQQSYTVHRRFPRSQFKRRTIRVRGASSRTDGDLIELTDLKPWNSGYAYIFTLVDAFSRKCYAEPLKNKEANSTAQALARIIERDSLETVTLYTDSGREFTGAPFQRVLEKHDIAHRVCTAQEFHCPFVERIVRTLKEKLFQAMTSRVTRRWLELLPLVVKTYNSTPHSSHELRPQEAHDPKRFLDALEILEKKRRKKLPVGGPTYRYRVGDHVRILREQTAFDKGYLPRYTWEIFRIAGRADTHPGDEEAIPAYLLEDLQGEPIEHSVFYEPELSLVRPGGDAVYPIREILARKGDKIKVWWQGFPKAGAEWIDRSRLEQQDE